MNEFKIEEEFEKESHSLNFMSLTLDFMSKRKLQKVAADLGYEIDYKWHPSYSEVFGGVKGILKKIVSENLILHDLNTGGSIYKKYLSDAQESPEFKKKDKMTTEAIRKALFKEMEKQGEKPERIEHVIGVEADLYLQGELKRIADKKTFERFGGVIFANAEQEKEYKETINHGDEYDRAEIRSLVHLKSIESGKPKVLLLFAIYHSKCKMGVNYQKINETQWKKYLNILHKNLEKK